MRRTIGNGLRLGCLTIVRELPMRGEGRKVQRWFLCRCDCGRECEYRTGDLFRREHPRRDCDHCSYPRAGAVPGKVPLTEGRVALVDESDWAEVMQWQWCVDAAGYANSSHGRMHNLIMGAKRIDHVSGDRLDNRRANLRAATHTQNMWNARMPVTNTSGFKGVCYDKRTKRWAAGIRANGVDYWLGRHDTAEEAARAYDQAAERLHGEYARTNGMETRIGCAEGASK